MTPNNTNEKNIHPTHCRWDFFLYLCTMNVELIEQYLGDKYGSLSLTKKRETYMLDDLFVYDSSEKKLIWYIDVESDLFSWFGPGNYYQVIHNWFIIKFGKEIGYDK